MVCPLAWGDLPRCLANLGLDGHAPSPAGDGELRNLARRHACGLATPHDSQRLERAAGPQPTLTETKTMGRRLVST